MDLGALAQLQVCRSLPWDWLSPEFSLAKPFCGSLPDRPGLACSLSIRIAGDFLPVPCKHRGSSARVPSTLCGAGI